MCVREFVRESVCVCVSVSVSVRVCASCGFCLERQVAQLESYFYNAPVMNNSRRTSGSILTHSGCSVAVEPK